MKVSGIISTLLLIAGSLFKIYHWPGAGVILTLGFFILCFLFLPSANYTMLKEGKDRRFVLLFLVAFLGSSGFFLGILFKIQHWSGTAVLLTAGSGLLCVIFFPLLLQYLLRKAKSIREKLIYSLGVISGMLFFLGMLFKLLHWSGAGIIQMAAAICITFLFIPLFSYLRFASSKYVKPGFIYIIAGISWFFMFGLLVSTGDFGNILQSFNIADRNIQNQIGILEQQNNSIYALPVDSGMGKKLQEVKILSDELFDYIQHLKIEIIQTKNEKNHLAVYAGNHINVSAISGNTNTCEPYLIMIGGENPGRATELKNKIISIRNELLNLANNDKTTSQRLSSCLSVDLPRDKPEWVDSWEMYYFESTTIIGCLDILSTFQRNLRLAENTVINYLVKHAKA
jgi:hypothetical protein